MSDDAPPHPPSSRVVFDKTIQVGTLLSMFTLALAGIGGAFAIYQGVQTQLYDQKMATATAVQKIDGALGDLRALRENMAQLKTDFRENVSQLKAEQKETDNALRKSLDAIADDLLKVRISLASRGRTGMLCDAHGSDCRTRAGLQSPAALEAFDPASDYPALHHKAVEPLRTGTFD